MTKLSLEVTKLSLEERDKFILYTRVFLGKMTKLLLEETKLSLEERDKFIFL